MPIIVLYDVTGRHAELKTQLVSLGYADKIVHFQDGGYKSIYLPNTTLYHATRTASQARDDVKATASGLQVILERCVSTQWGPEWAAIYGQPFS